MGAVPLAARLVGLLHEHGQTLATAESLTGGGVGAAVTSVPGASEVYLGGVIAYATDLKRTHLGVSDATVRDPGVVSAECALEMARGVVDRTGADWGLSTTGVAGPDPQEGQPVGLVFIGVVGPQGVVVERHHFDGDRDEVRRQAVERALDQVLRLLRPDTP